MPKEVKHQGLDMQVPNSPQSVTGADDKYFKAAHSNSARKSPYQDKKYLRK